MGTTKAGLHAALNVDAAGALYAGRQERLSATDNHKQGQFHSAL